MLVYAKRESARLHFLVNFLNSFYGTSIRLTHRDEDVRLGNVAINYSDVEHIGGIQVKPHGLLFQKTITHQQIEMGHWEGIPCFFKTLEEGEVPFDIFSTTFYLITRYEEYLPYQEDEHGRFPFEASLASKYRFSEKAVVDRWLLLLAQKLKQANGIDLVKRKFTFVSTIDIDKAFAYKYQPFPLRQLSWLKSMQNGEYKRRMLVIKNRVSDPFDRFDYFHHYHSKYDLRPIVFIQVGNRGVYDKNLSVKNRKMKEVIKNIAQWADMGLHPSYASFQNEKKLKREYDRLQPFVGYELDDSRQHYLRFKLPDTYQMLLQQGITKEYSMGYSHAVGFRSGTCTPHKFYDLSNEEETNLMIYPLIAMDVTLSHHLKLSMDEAKKKLKSLMDEVKQVDGTFISLWHNSSFSALHQMLGWNKVFEFMLKEANAND